MLFPASRDRRPHALVVALPCFSARALRDPEVDDAVPDLLFAVVIRWLDGVGKHEAKIVL